MFFSVEGLLLSISWGIAFIMLVLYLVYRVLSKLSGPILEAIKLWTDSSAQVPVNEQTKALYDKLLELGGTLGLQPERVSRGAVEFVRQYSGYYPEGCKLLSVKLVGPIPMSTVLTVDCTYKLHVMGEFRLKGHQDGPPSRIDCNFLIDMRQKTAVLYMG